MPESSYNRIIINLTALADNYRALQGLVGPAVDILAMVKSDAYGHGLIRCTKALSLAGVSHFGVAELAEGIVLRQAGVTDDVIVFLGCTDVQALIRYKLTPVVFDIENIGAISAAAITANTTIGVHVKIDVGMGRLGIMPKEFPSYAAEITRLPGVFLAGVISHFPMADQDESLTRGQSDKLVRLVDSLAEGPTDGGIKPICIHMANSAALIQYPQTYHQMVRPGIGLYGCYPADNLSEAVTLKPVMSFKTQVLQVKNVPTGCGISYGHLFKTVRPSRMAILPVGYADGYLRSLTGKASVLIKGQRAPVCGRICMNACIVDVTDIPDVTVGDEVVLLGRQNQAEITAEEVAAWMDTINYEVLCLFGNSNTREYR